VNFDATRSLFPARLILGATRLIPGALIWTLVPQNFIDCKRLSRLTSSTAPRRSTSLRIGSVSIAARGILRDILARYLPSVENGTK
jgi:hypothetical protein